MATMTQARRMLVGILDTERRVYNAASRALREWLPVVEGAVFGTSLTAGAEGVLSTAQQWETMLDRHVMPALEAAMIDRLLVKMEEEGTLALLPPPPPTTGKAGESAAAMLWSWYDGDHKSKAQTVYAVPGIRERQGLHLAEVRNRLTGVPDSVFDLITDSLSVSIAEGETEAQQAMRVQKILDWAGEENWEGRARMIARTEATGAYNRATVLAAQAAQEVTGVRKTKGWLSCSDERTRATHWEADGQVVELDQPFRVGGYDMQYPGDPNGPVQEVVNCRCVVVDMDTGEKLPKGPIVHPERNGEKRTPERDAGDGSLTAATTTTKGHTMGKAWKGVLAPLGAPTGDGRMFAEQATVQFREFPLPLLWQKQTSEVGHAQAFTVGAIRSAKVEGGNIVAEGVLFDTPEAGEAAEQIREGVTRPSVDLCDDVWELTDKSGNAVDMEDYYNGALDEDPVMRFTSFTVMAATLVAKPAFAEARVVIDEESEVADVAVAEAALVASAGTSHRLPSKAMFENPNLEGPTGVHMLEDGRIVGHLALWNDCHMGVGNACVRAPRTQTGYSLFHVSEIETTDGPVAVGKLTVGGGHADPTLGVHPAVEHYDNAGTCFALVRAGEDQHGIWVSGVAAPWADDKTVSMGLASPLSGDWRRHGGNLELVAALSVNTPGFPVPRGARDNSGRDYALVAAGVLPPATPTDRLTATVAEAADAIGEFVRTLREHSDEARARLEAREQGTTPTEQEHRMAALRRTRAELLRRRVMGGGDK